MNIQSGEEIERVVECRGEWERVGKKGESGGEWGKGKLCTLFLYPNCATNDPYVKSST